MSDVIEIHGHKAVVTFDPETGMFRGEFEGLRGEGGAEFCAKDREQLIEKGRQALELYYDTMGARAAEEAVRRLARDEDDLMPAAWAERLLDGEHPVRMWREYRGLSLEELAETAGISVAHLTQIESGEVMAAPYTVASLADALKIDPEDLA